MACDTAAKSIMKAYSTPECVKFAASASDTTKVTLQAAAWCKGGATCLQKLVAPMASFRNAKCSIDMSTSTQAAARAVMNAEICSVNAKGRYCAEFQNTLYLHADKQMKAEAVKQEYKVDCQQL